MHGHEIFDFQVFFRESVSPKPLSIPLRPFRIFSQLNATSGNDDKFFTPGVVDTSGKFAISVVDTGGAP